jgi:molybdenum cofactor cytidylyltransferase
MTTLTQALSIKPGDCVAVVGAGGKTTLCWRLTQEIAAQGGRVIFTTTTKIWQPAEGTFDWLYVGPLPHPLPVGEGGWKSACLAASIDGATNTTPINGAGMPTVQTKLAGYTADELCALTRSTNHQSPITLLVEADGARGLRIKAPGNGEPVIPPCADVVCVLANLDAIGRPLDERIAHRVDRVAQLTRTMPGSIITAPLLVELLANPEGGLKGVPSGARKVAVLTQQGETTPHPDAARMMAELAGHGFDRAVTIAPRAVQPAILS